MCDAFRLNQAQQIRVIVRLIHGITSLSMVIVYHFGFTKSIGFSKFF
nr:MAG TPA: hypothetical protein [Caudoviricetes sp.]